MYGIFGLLLVGIPWVAWLCSFAIGTHALHTWQTKGFALSEYRFMNINILKAVFLADLWASSISSVFPLAVQPLLFPELQPKISIYVLSQNGLESRFQWCRHCWLQFQQDTIRDGNTIGSVSSRECLDAPAILATFKWKWRESRAHRDTHGWRLSLAIPLLDFLPKL